MQGTTRSRSGAAIALLVAVTGALPTARAIAPASEAAARVQAEIVALERSLADEPLAGADAEGLTAACKGALDASTGALDAGRLYLSLESLRRAEGLIRGARFAAEKDDAVASGLPAFESEWAGTSRALATDNPPRSDRKWSRSRAAVRALAETAQGRIGPLLEGARGFAVATGPKDGLFYMGQAEGESRFAALCATLTFPEKRSRYPLRSMLPELQRLQEKATAAFVPPRSIELHDRFIALNSTIKAGLELDASEAYAGSAYQYLEAVRHYGMLQAAPLDEAAQARVEDDLAATRARLEASQRDESLALVFLERGAAQVAHLDGSPATVDEWRSARVILDDVLPAYFAARLPAVPRGSSGRTVRMTLVRWPYT